LEIAIVKVGVDGTRLTKRKLINPQNASSKRFLMDIHGITDEMVRNAPTFKQVANEIKQFIEHCDIGGYNSNRSGHSLLVEEFLRTWP